MGIIFSTEKDLAHQALRLSEQSSKRNGKLTNYREDTESGSDSECENKKSRRKSESENAEWILKSVSEIETDEPSQTPEAFRDQDYEELKKKHLKSGKLFSDYKFPTGGLKMINSKQVVWKRPHEICKEPKFIVGDMDMHDIDQGEIGNCWLIAALASLANQEKLLDFIVPEKESQTFDAADYCGIFHFRFWNNGKWVDICVDDRLPVSPDGKLLLCSNKQEPDEFWAALLEKAYAKLYGGYENLDGGFLNDAFVDLTGGIPRSFRIGQALTNQYYRNTLTNETWMSLVETHEKNSLVAVSTDYSYRNRHGLVEQHAYTVVKMASVKDLEKNEVRLVQVRNPWGDGGEWKGPWSDRSKKWQSVSESIRKQLHPKASDDGVFWISIEDFITYFDNVHICDLQSYDYSVSNHGKWSDESSGGSDERSPTYWKNPQFMITIDKLKHSNQINMIVSLLVKNNRENHIDCPDKCIKFDVYQIKPEFVQQAIQSGSVLNKSQLVRLETPKCDQYSREVSCEFSAEAGSYVIIPSRKAANQTGEFLLRAYSETSLDEFKPLINIDQLKRKPGKMSKSPQVTSKRLRMK